jgi:hypothetical protein
MFRRLIEPHLREALLDTRVVLLVGPRRAGKTTLAREAGGEDRAYLTLDDQTTLDAARADPVAFIRGLDRVTIDEIQRVPGLLLAIKKSVDNDPRPGRFLLTGTANVLTLPKVADSLAGRLETVRLLPLSQAEILGRTPFFLESVFAARLPAPDNIVTGNALVELVLTGGFPEVLSRSTERRRQDWARSYLHSVLARDLRDIADVEKLTDLPKFVRLLAEHAGQLVNYSQIGSGIYISHKTAQRYVGLLEQIFLVAALQPWYTNRIKRIIKTSKLHFLDSGLLAASRGLTIDRIARHRQMFGALLESFVFAEIMKLATVSSVRLTPYHFRDQDMREVDIVLETDDGRIAGLEIKAGATVSDGDFAGLRKLADACKSRFVFGAVLYDGDTIVPFGKTLVAAPISCLWN